jgi:hypothetical protein
MSKKPANNSGKTGLKAKLVAFFETRIGHGSLALSAAVLGYLFIIWAIDSGNLFDWLIVIILTIIAVRETAAFVRLTLNRNER